jgi:hypothetical protein
MIPAEVVATAVPRTSNLSRLGRRPEPRFLQRQFASAKLVVSRHPVPGVLASLAQVTSFPEWAEFLWAGEL